MSEYIILASSDGGTTKRFWAVDMGLARERRQSMAHLTGGRPSVVSGRSLDSYDYTLLVPESSGDANWGTLADLRQLFSLSNPQADPSDVITLTTHDGTEVECRITSNLPQKPETVILAGTTAYYKVPISLVDVTRPEMDFSEADYSFYVAVI